jgi:hypothetical protein
VIAVIFSKLSLGLLRKGTALKTSKYRGRHKAATFETDMVLAGSASVVRQEQAARHVQSKLVLGTAHGNVQKPPFLFDLRDTGCEF